jgi:hypothetical protein
MRNMDDGFFFLGRGFFPRKGPDIIGRGVVPFPYPGNEGIHHRFEPLYPGIPGPFKADLVAPGGNTPSERTFDNLEVSVVGAANPG